MKIITVTVDKVGRPTIEAEGFQGQDCKAATKGIEEAFKGGEMKVEDKPEIHLPSPTKTVKNTV